MPLFWGANFLANIATGDPAMEGQDVIDDAGHLMNMEQPEIFNQAVMRFVNGLGASESDRF